eukprot:NODE_7583_length_432_cov_1.517241.p2 GENE.NODE_7583_length_432_cov_1.517241~~NODE_7583_length_432_cov_1.517241.p2  ORF type:complete len:67 (-),score=10.67 NODE_7583_length_432_cov_1.517241:154-354(-)
MVADHVRSTLRCCTRRAEGRIATLSPAELRWACLVTKLRHLAFKRREWAGMGILLRAIEERGEPYR